MTGEGLILLVIVVVIVIVVLCVSRKDNMYLKKGLEKEGRINEGLSYSFGFPTKYEYGYSRYPIYDYGRGYGMYPGYGAWGTPYPYYPQGHGPGTWYTPSIIRRQERRRRQRDRKMYTARCYDADEDDDCIPGYRNTGKDTDGDNIDDEWECCRRR